MITQLLGLKVKIEVKDMDNMQKVFLVYRMN